MGELIDKVKGNVNEAIGKAKQAVAGDGPDRNEELAGEGAAQEGKGKAQQTVGSVKGALGDDI
ncbi:MAG: CsbD family protein [Pseudomonadota bacterium]